MKSRSIFLLTPVFGAIFGAIIVNAGCASVDVTSMHYLTAPTYAPTAPASIQILNAEPKTAFQRIGEIELSGSSDPAPEEADVEKKLRMAAGKLGADAVLITADRIQPNGVQSSGFRRFGGNSQLTAGRKVVAIAIKFTSPSS